VKAEAKARNLQGIRDTISLVHSASHTSLRFAGDAGPPATRGSNVNHSSGFLSS